MIICEICKVERATARLPQFVKDPGDTWSSRQRADWWRGIRAGQKPVHKSTAGRRDPYLRVCTQCANNVKMGVKLKDFAKKLYVE